jgi:hypothetical protein
MRECRTARRPSTTTGRLRECRTARRPRATSGHPVRTEEARRPRATPGHLLECKTTRCAPERPCAACSNAGRHVATERTRTAVASRAKRSQSQHECLHAFVFSLGTPPSIASTSTRYCTAMTVHLGWKMSHHHPRGLTKILVADDGT